MLLQITEREFESRFCCRFENMKALATELKYYDPVAVMCVGTRYESPYRIISKRHEPSGRKRVNEVVRPKRRFSAVCT